MARRIAVGLCAMLLVAGAARAQNPVKDERAIEAAGAHWQDDWNHGNFKALASLFSVDADYVTSGGAWLEGRAAVEDWLAKQFPAPGQGGRWTNDKLTVRFLQPDMAVVHVRWQIQVTLETGRGPGNLRAGISTWLLVKLGNGWKIRAAQDTPAAP